MPYRRTRPTHHILTAGHQLHHLTHFNSLSSVGRSVEHRIFDTLVPLCFEKNRFDANRSDLFYILTFRSCPCLCCIERNIHSHTVGCWIDHVARRVRHLSTSKIEMMRTPANHSWESDSLPRSPRIPSESPQDSNAKLVKAQCQPRFSTSFSPISFSKRLFILRILRLT